MKALVYTDTLEVQYRDEPDPEPGPGEALIEIEAVGICGSDMHAYHGHDARRVPPLILGHEAVGVAGELALDRRQSARDAGAEVPLQNVAMEGVHARDAAGAAQGRAPQRPRLGGVGVHHLGAKGGQLTPQEPARTQVAGERPPAGQAGNPHGIDATLAQGLEQVALAGLGAIRARHGDLDDGLVREAVVAVRKTAETRDRGVLYEHPPADARAEALVKELADIFEAQGEDGARHRPSERALVAALRALENALAGTIRENEGPHAFLDTAARLVARLGGRSAAPRPRRLIVEP